MIYVFFFLLCFGSPLFASDDFKTQYRSMSESNLKSIEEAYTQGLSDAERAPQPAKKKHCCKKSCSRGCWNDFKLPIITLTVMLGVAFGCGYCKHTKSCLGFEDNDRANNTLANLTMPSLNQSLAQLPTVNSTIGKSYQINPIKPHQARYRQKKKRYIWPN